MKYRFKPIFIMRIEILDKWLIKNQILKSIVFLRNIWYSNKRTTVLQGALTSFLFFKRMGVMLMKNQFDFGDIMAFGLFLIALLTFVFTFCKWSYIAKPPWYFDRWTGGFAYHIGQPLVGGCSCHYNMSERKFQVSFYLTDFNFPMRIVGEP